VMVLNSTSPWVHLFEIQCTQTHFDRLWTGSCCRHLGKLRLSVEEIVPCVLARILLPWSDSHPLKLGMLLRVVRWTHALRNDVRRSVDVSSPTRSAAAMERRTNSWGTPDAFQSSDGADAPRTGVLLTRGFAAEYATWTDEPSALLPLFAAARDELSGVVTGPILLLGRGFVAGRVANEIPARRIAARVLV